MLATPFITLNKTSWLSFTLDGIYLHSNHQRNILGCYSFSHGSFLVPVTFKISFGILMVNQSLICFVIQQAVDTYNYQHHHYCWREQPLPVPRWVWRQKPHQLGFLWYTQNPEDNSIMWGHDSRLCLFSHYQIHPTSINKTNGASSSEDGMTADVKTILVLGIHELLLVFLSKSRSSKATS